MTDFTNLKTVFKFSDFKLAVFFDGSEQSKTFAVMCGAQLLLPWESKSEKDWKILVGQEAVTPGHWVVRRAGELGTLCLTDEEFQKYYVVAPKKDQPK